MRHTSTRAAKESYPDSGTGQVNLEAKERRRSKEEQLERDRVKEGGGERRGKRRGKGKRRG